MIWVGHWRRSADFCCRRREQLLQRRYHSDISIISSYKTSYRCFIFTSFFAQNQHLGVKASGDTLHSLFSLSLLNVLEPNRCGANHTLSIFRFSRASVCAPMTEHFPPSNPIFLIRILVLLVLQDIQGTILYLLRFCDGYIDADMLRDYVENYPEYFMANLEEKQYLVQRYTPQLIQELALLPTSLTRIQRVLSHPFVEGAVMTMFSLLVLLLLFHRTQIQPEILLDAQWPQSKDLVAADSSAATVVKDEKEMRRAQSILHMKSFPAAPASSSIPVGRTGSNAIIDRQHMPQRSAVQPKASVTEPSQIDNNGKTEAVANESEASYEREQSQREAAKNARLKQFPPPSNPLAQV